MGLDIKQVIVIRRDLKMRRGKEIAQGSHASISFMTQRLSTLYDDVLHLSEAERLWIADGFKKVCVQVHSEEELLDIYFQALAARLEVNLITDSGHTEFHMVPTTTCLAIGPDYAEKIDPITGKLQLY